MSINRVCNASERTEFHREINLRCINLTSENVNTRVEHSKRCALLHWVWKNASRNYLKLNEIQTRWRTVNTYKKKKLCSARYASHPICFCFYFIVARSIHSNNKLPTFFFFNRVMSHSENRLKLFSSPKREIGWKFLFFMPNKVIVKEVFLFSQIALFVAIWV